MKIPLSVPTVALIGSFLMQLSQFSLHAHSSPGELDLSFDPGSGVNGHIYAIAMQPDGKSIIGGAYMTRVKGVICQNIARINADGSGDGTFHYSDPIMGFSAVRAIELQVDGKVLVGHNNGISRLNADGSLDPNFMSHVITPSGVEAIAVQSDGKILIGGGFSGVGGSLRSRIARLHADGSLDHAFLPDTVNGFYSGVFSIVVQPDGKVLIGGQSLTVNNASVSRLNANGSLDGTFGTVVVDDAIRSVALEPDGKVLVVGMFTAVNGTNRNGIARLDANGSLDNSFNPGTGADRWIYALALQPDGKVLIGGDFFAFGGTNRNRIARLHANGSLDSAFDPGPGPHPNMLVMVLQPDGRILAGGAPGGDQVADYNILTRFNGDGIRDDTFVAGGGVEGRVSSLVIQPDRRILVGGVFDYVNGTRRSGLARLNSNGSLDGTFIPGVDIGIPAPVTSIALQPDGKVLIGGGPTFVDGTNTLRGGIARIHSDGRLDGSFNPGTGADGGTVGLVALQPDGGMFIGGDFNTVTGIPRKSLARLNSDGSVDSTFNGNIDGYTKVNSVVVQPDGKVLVGGKFSTEESTNVYAVARLHGDGSLDDSFQHGINTDVSAYIEAYTVVLQSDGRVLVQGLFQIDGWVGNYLVRLHPDGSVDNAFYPGPSTDVYGPITSQPDGKVLVAGGLDRRGNDDPESIPGPCRLNADGSLDLGFSVNSTFDGGVDSIVLQSDGSVLLGGGFLEIDGVLRQYVARLHGDVLPSLTIARSGSTEIVSWFSSATGFVLQHSVGMHPAHWTTPSETVTDNGTTKSITVSLEPANRFFRLFKH